MKRQLKTIKWNGDNLKEVVDFTGKNPEFEKWFKSWDDYENYVHSHGNIFKIFYRDGSHYEVPAGASIIKWIDGTNVPTEGRFVDKRTDLLSMLLEAIDYSFLKTDMTYDKSLTYPVIDKVNYIKKVLGKEDKLWD